jgi:hypothetical protein
MKRLILPLLLIATLLTLSCEDEKITTDSCDNGVVATVKDLTGLDGCGFVFELSDGSRLEPQMLFFCGTPPLPAEITENPLYNFQWVEGKVVRIKYEELSNGASICMVGNVVKITCLQEITTQEE